MPIYPEGYFETEEDYRKFKEGEKGLPTLTERIEEYLRTVKPAEPKLSWAERIGWGLWNTVSNFFSIMWDGVWSNFRKSLSGIAEDVTKLFFKQLTTAATPGIKEWLSHQVERSDLPQATKDNLISKVKEGTPLDYASVFLYGLFADIATIASVVTAGYELGQQSSRKILLPSLPGLGDIFTARFRDPKYETLIDDYMMRMGYNKDVRDMLKLVSWTLLNPDQVRDLYLRGDIDKAEREKRLLALGVKPEDIESLEKLYYFIPGPNDLVRMAVREAWDESFARKWGTDLDFPGEFLEWAKKSGLSEFWAKKFWRAHWELPGPSQGFEMLHRGVISWDDLKGLLKALDVMPGWREKLLAISYSPYTRVDVRRMYGAGVIKKEDVYKTYKDLGYDDDHATNLTTFTVKNALETERDLTKSEILSIYEREIIKREAASDMIIELGYSKEEAEIFLSKLDYDIAKKLKEKELSFVEKNYIAGVITYEEARGRLSKLNLGGAELSKLFKDWDIEKEGKLAELTFTQLQSLLITKVIDEDTFKSELKGKNFSDKYVTWLLELTKKKVVQE